MCFAECASILFSFSFLLFRQALSCIIALKDTEESSGFELIDCRHETKKWICRRCCFTRTFISLNVVFSSAHALLYSQTMPPSLFLSFLFCFVLFLAYGFGAAVCMWPVPLHYFSTLFIIIVFTHEYTHTHIYIYIYIYIYI